MSVSIDVKPSRLNKEPHIVTIRLDPAHWDSYTALAEFLHVLEYETAAETITVDATGIGVAAADIINENRAYINTAVVSYYPANGGNAEDAAKEGIEQCKRNRANRIQGVQS